MTPNVDINLLVVQNLPPNKRKTVWISFIQSLADPLNWAMGIFNQYKNGGVVAFYEPLLIYNAGERVIYNYKVYESIIGSNTGNTPDTTPTAWLEVNTSFIGVYERSLFRGNKLVFERALNRYFREELVAHGYIGFRQPDNAFTPTPSDIYIETLVPTGLSILGLDAITPEDTLRSIPTGYWGFDGLVVSASSTYQFNIYIPTLVYLSINSDSTIAERIVRNFADKYRVAGTNYNIITY